MFPFFLGILLCNLWFTASNERDIIKFFLWQLPLFVRIERYAFRQIGIPHGVRCTRCTQCDSIADLQFSQNSGMFYLLYAWCISNKSWVGQNMGFISHYFSSKSELTFLHLCFSAQKRKFCSPLHFHIHEISVFIEIAVLRNRKLDKKLTNL